MMSLYQAIAEKGKGVCETKELYSTCAKEDYGTLTKADGMIYPDAHPGNPVQALRSLNPAITIENGKKTVDASLECSIPRTATIRTARRPIRRPSSHAITRHSRPS